MSTGKCTEPKNIKIEKFTQRHNTESSRGCCDSNIPQSRIEEDPKSLDLQNVPSIQIEDLSLITSTNDLKMTVPGSSNQEKCMPVRSKRKSRTLVIGPKTPNKKQIDWSKELSPRRSNAEDSKLITTRIPDIDSLKEAHRKNYKARLLDKMFDYSKLNDNHLSQKDSDNIHLSVEAMDSIKNFDTGVKLLKKKFEKSGKELIEKASNEKLPFAKYVWALITMREFVLCRSSKNKDHGKSKLPLKKELKLAVSYMQDVRQHFFPLPDFVLGIIQLYNIDYLSELIGKESKLSPWLEYFYDIVTMISDVEGSETSQIWADISISPDYCKVARKQSSYMKYIDVHEDENGQYLKWIGHCIKYEIASNALTVKNLNLGKSLLKELASDGFTEAKYSYAIALIKNEFNDLKLIQKPNVDEALHLLDSIKDDHQETKLLLGTMPFRKEFAIEIERKELKGLGYFYLLEEYMNCDKVDFRKESAVLVAAEYLKRDGSCMTYDEGKAKTILATYGCTEELQELEKNLQALKEAKNALPDVLEALKEVTSKLEQSGGIYAAKLVPILRPLFDELQIHRLTVQKSLRLSLVLEQLHIESTEKNLQPYFLSAPITILCDLLRSEEYSQPCSFQRNVFSLLSDLSYACLTMDIERIHTWKL